MICGPNLAKFSAHTRESTESSPPSWPCCSRQLRSGNTQPRTLLKTTMPSASGTWGPAMPSTDIDMPTTTLVISVPLACGCPCRVRLALGRSAPAVLYIRRELFRTTPGYSRQIGLRDRVLKIAGRGGTTAAWRGAGDLPCLDQVGK